MCRKIIAEMSNRQRNICIPRQDLNQQPYGQEWMVTEHITDCAYGIAPRDPSNCLTPT